MPAGFMPAVAQGSLALGFCDSGVATVQRSRGPDGLAAATGASMVGPAGLPALLAENAAHGDHAPARTGGSHAGSECPFAQSAGPLLGSASNAPPPAPPPTAIDARTALVTVPTVAPLRHAAPRGPPLIPSMTA